MTVWLLVVVGAAVGAPCRWLLDQAIQRRAQGVLPWGTMTANVLGSLLLGMLLALSLEEDTGTRLLALAGTGFCGAFTTFSTFMYETVVLTEEGSAGVGLANIALSLAAGMLAAFAGWGLVTGIT